MDIVSESGPSSDGREQSEECAGKAVDASTHPSENHISLAQTLYTEFHLPWRCCSLKEFCLLNVSDIWLTESEILTVLELSAS